MRKNVNIICDLQFGSTGKGAAAGYLAMKTQPDICVTAWAPNSGHTFIDAHGRKFVHCALANGIVSPKLRGVMLAPGSVIDVPRLVQELIDCHDIMKNKTLFIHENAAIVGQRHRDEENATMTGIGSTKKGSGAALIEKLKRDVKDNITAKAHVERIANALQDLVAQVYIVNTMDWNDIINEADLVQVEGAQGFSLGVNSGFYPYCTSRECTPAQIMSDCLIPMKRINKVIGVMRTYPIRVANRYDENGNQIGYSGPGYRDQKELTWEELGQTPEITTVTKLRRRVFSFSWDQTEAALSVCAPDEIFLSFCDYLSDEKAHDLFTRINKMSHQIVGPGTGVKYRAWGPSILDVQEECITK